MNGTISGPFSLLARALKGVFSRPDVIGQAFVVMLVVYGFQEVFVQMVELVAVADIHVGAIAAATIIGAFVYMVVASFVFIGVAVAAIHPEQMSVWRGIVWGLERWAPFTALGCLFYLIFMSGLTLLLIPALVFLVYGSYAFYVYMLEGRHGIEAFVRATDVVEGSFWRVVARWIVLAFATWMMFVPLLMLLTIGSFFGDVITLQWDSVESSLFSAVVVVLMSVWAAPTTLFTIHFHRELFTDLAASKPAHAFQYDAYSVLRRVYKWAAWLAIPLLFLLFGTLGYIGHQEAERIAWCSDWENESDIEYYEICADYIYDDATWENYDFSDDFGADYSDDYYDDYDTGAYVDLENIGTAFTVSNTNPNVGESVSITFTVTNNDTIDREINSIDVSAYLMQAYGLSTYEPVPVEEYDNGTFISLYYYETLAPGESYEVTLSGVVAEPLSPLIAEMFGVYVDVCVDDVYTCKTIDLLAEEG